MTAIADLQPEYILGGDGKTKAVILSLECITALLQRINQYEQGEHVCEYGYTHTPNQETIDAINTPDSELLHYNSFSDFLEEIAHEAG